MAVRHSINEVIKVVRQQQLFQNIEPLWIPLFFGAIADAAATFIIIICVVLAVGAAAVNAVAAAVAAVAAHAAFS